MVWTGRLAYRRPMTITRENECSVTEVTTLRVEGAAQEESVLRRQRWRESRDPQPHGSYSWLEDYLVRLDGKEAREEYYARFE